MHSTSCPIYVASLVLYFKGLKVGAKISQIKSYCQIILLSIFGRTILSNGLELFCKDVGIDYILKPYDFGTLKNPHPKKCYRCSEG